MVRNKRKVIYILLGFVLISLALSLIPPFLYNEYELKFRKEFALAFASGQKAEKAIPLRQAGPGKVLNNEEFVNYGKGIEASIAEEVQYLEKAKRNNLMQDKIVFFLGRQYREYHEKKKAAINEDLELTKLYLTRKQNEQMMSNTMLLVANDMDIILDIKNDKWWETADSLPGKIQTITENANKMHAAGYINEEMYKYLMEVSKIFQFMSTQSQNISAAESWSVFDLEGFNQVTAGDPDVNRLFDEARIKWDGATAEFYSGIDANDIKLEEASDFYNSNRLAFDKLSMLLSLFNKNFPRIRVIENVKPTIIPSEVPSELISLVMRKGLNYEK